MNSSKFKRSLQPLTCLLTLIGVDLTKSVRNSKWLFFYATICLFLNIASQMDVIIYCFQNIREFSILGFGKLETITSAWSTVMDTTNYAIHGVVGHVVLLFVVRIRWATLIERFSRLEDQLAPEFFVKLRRISIFATGFIILWVIKAFSKYNFKR